MLDALTPPNCLNCGSKLQGPFCATCGQRAIGAYPTVREMIGDAWEELSGFDGRVARTLRLLLARPGALTVEALEGRRARYVSPVRVYLLASVVYFICAAAVPNLRLAAPAVIPGAGVTIAVDASGETSQLSPEARAQALRDIARAPWWAQAILRPIVADPAAFRSRFIQRLPRVLFALVPVFAAILASFYRRRRFPQHLIFAIHLHAAIFVALTVRELSQLTGSFAVLRIFDVSAAVAIVAYALLAFRRVYRESWPRMLAKTAGIAIVYAITGIFALIVVTLWAAVFG